MTKAEHRPAKGPGGGMKTPEPNARQPRGLTAVDVVLRALAAAALAVDAGVHARLADGYQSAAPEGFGEGNLFLAEAAGAALAGVFVLIRGSKPAWMVVLLTAGGGLAALLLYRYVDLPAFGPFPAMYEPVWFFDKVLTACAQASAVLLAGTALVLRRRRARKSTRAL